MTHSGVIRMLVFTRETFPTFRVDVEKLFGKEMIGRGHEVDFVMQASSPAVPAGPTPWHGRTVWVGAAGSRRGAIGRAVTQLKSFAHDARCLMQLARRPRYEAIQIRNKFLIAALASFVARSRGIKFFYWLSFPVPESQAASGRDKTARFPVVNQLRGRIFGWLLYSVILPRCDHIFVQSEQMKEDLRAQGANPEKMTPVPMGIDPQDFPPMQGNARKVGSADGAFVLGYLGTLGAQRRLEILIDTLWLLCKCGIDAKLLLVGGSDNVADVDLLIRRAHEHGVEGRIEITGLMPRERAIERIREADIALSPFFPTMVLQSTSPTKLVEYMALALPVVANRHPEQQMILRESRAGVCVPWGARHFARGAAWLARQDVRMRQEIGERGRQWVMRNRDYARIADALERRYLEALEDALAGA